MRSKNVFYILKIGILLTWEVRYINDYNDNIHFVCCIRFSTIIIQIKKDENVKNINNIPMSRKISRSTNFV